MFPFARENYQNMLTTQCICSLHGNLKIEFMKNKFRKQLHEITFIDKSWHINMILCYGWKDNLKLNTFHTLLIKWNVIIEYLEVFDAQSSVQKQ